MKRKTSQRGSKRQVSPLEGNKGREKTEVKNLEPGKFAEIRQADEKLYFADARGVSQNRVEPKRRYLKVFESEGSAKA